MNKPAPRCSDARSDRSVPACGSSGPSSAKTGAAKAPTNRIAANSEGSALRSAGLVMRGHPFRHRLGLVELGPQRHRDEEDEVEEGQRAADDHLGRVGTGTAADLAEPDAADRAHALHQPRELAPVAIALD